MPDSEAPAAAELRLVEARRKVDVLLERQRHLVDLRRYLYVELAYLESSVKEAKEEANRALEEAREHRRRAGG